MATGKAPWAAADVWRYACENIGVRWSEGGAFLKRQAIALWLCLPSKAKTKTFVFDMHTRPILQRGYNDIGGVAIAVVVSFYDAKKKMKKVR